jgi:hypothetical protein
MSEHTEWGEIWVIVRWAFGAHENWPHFEVDGKRKFHIHDARHHLATLDKAEGWQILQAYGYYPPEEWVGNPSHPVNRHCPRMPRPEGITFMNEAAVPPDHDHSKRDKI